MTNRIGVDMDGVILDNFGRWAIHYNENMKAHNHAEVCVKQPPTWDYYPELCLSCYNTLVVSDIDMKTPLVEGAKEGLARLRELGELWVVSHRDPSLTLTAIRILKKNGIYDYFTSFEWSYKSKLRTCQKYGISVLIDDGPSNIKELRGTQITSITYDYIYNRGIGGYRAKNWDDVVGITAQIFNERKVIAV